MTERSQAFDVHALPLCLAAIQRACPAGVGTITHIIVTTCTGAIAPGLDIQLAKALGLPADVRRTMIAFMGCYAAIPALRNAWYTCRADPQARVLVVCCELSTLHLRPGPEDDALIAALLFGDGAGAAIVESADEPTGLGVRIVSDACMLVPDSSDQMTWMACSEGFSLRLSPRLTISLGERLLPLSGALLGPERPAASVGWLVHPGGPRILEAAQLALSLPTGALDASRATLHEGGNRSSATLLAILDRALQTPGRGLVAMTAFGPGLTADALLVERCQ